MTGECEADETFIGGKARNMHIACNETANHRFRPKRQDRCHGNPSTWRLRRRKINHSKVRTAVISDRKKKTIQAEVKANVQRVPHFLDALHSYDGLESEYAHQVVDHAVEYVRGKVHTNGLENFWCLFKRGVNGTYVCMEPFHLFRYLDEMEFRFNNRGTRISPYRW